ncbi:MAG: M28 family peptidase [Candidatus Riflebacteria bacterium]|nr:M28 family peptidase [Candidatus Riflebacteria bacterium]
MSDEGTPRASRWFGIELWPRGRMKKRLVVYAVLLVVGWAFMYWSCRCRDDGTVGKPPKELLEIETRLKASVHHLAQTIGKRSFQQFQSLERAADWIVECWKGQGLRPTEHTYIGMWKLRFRNLEVDVAGPAGAPIVIVGAHYDSMFETPGADDNASGVAALLEISRALAGKRLTRRLRCVAFANEEPPFFDTAEMGSRMYAAHAKNRGDRIAAMVSLECLGYYTDVPRSQKYPPIFSWFYPDRGNFVGVVGNLGSRALVGDFARMLRRSTDVPVQCCSTWGGMSGIFWSDHSSFWPLGVPAVMVTDTALFRNPNYHEESDRPGTLDYGRFARVTAGLADAVRLLCGGE